MLHNLRAEMARNGIQKKEMAEAISITEKTLFNKIYGHTQFTAREMLAIKDTFFPDMDLEYLFASK